MKEMQFSVDIDATKEKVWNTLWRDETFRQWAGIIDPGTHMVGELKVGNEVQFISANGYGVTSLVKKLTVGEFLLLNHRADTQDAGEQEREKEWAGSEESYRLMEKGDTTVLTVNFGIPPKLEEYFKVAYPKALERVKKLAERKEQ